MTKRSRRRLLLMSPVLLAYALLFLFVLPSVCVATFGKDQDARSACATGNKSQKRTQSRGLSESQKNKFGDNGRAEVVTPAPVAKRQCTRSCSRGDTSAFTSNSSSSSSSSSSASAAAAPAAPPVVMEEDAEIPTNLGEFRTAIKIVYVSLGSPARADWPTKSGTISKIRDALNDKACRRHARR